MQIVRSIDYMVFKYSVFRFTHAVSGRCNTLHLMWHKHVSQMVVVCDHQIPGDVSSTGLLFYLSDRYGDSFERCIWCSDINAALIYTWRKTRITWSQSDTPWYRSDWQPKKTNSNKPLNVEPHTATGGDKTNDKYWGGWVIYSIIYFTTRHSSNRALYTIVVVSVLVLFYYYYIIDITCAWCTQPTFPFIRVLEHASIIYYRALQPIYIWLCTV